MLMKDLKISLILPCYNVAKYVTKCLDSIINQTYKNLEIICVNDGSLDNTLEVLNEYKKKDDRIIVVSQENMGLSGARNTGAKYVTGDYLMYVDSDDWLELDTCEKVIIEAIQNDADLVIWNYTREFVDKSLPRYILGDIKQIFEGEECHHKIHRRIFGLYEDELSAPETADSLVTAWGKLYRSSIILDNDIKFVDTKLIGTEDALFNIYALKHVEKAVYIPDCLYHYRKDNVTSLTKTYKPNLYKQWQYLYDLIELNINENEYDDKYQKSFYNRIALSIIGLGLNLMDADKDISKIKEIKNIISSQRYRDAYKQLTLKYFPIHWKVFFAFAKCNFALGVYVLLMIINYIR